MGTLVLRATKGTPLTHAEVDANWLALANPSENQTWTKSQRGAFATLTSAASSIAVDLNLSNNYSHTLTENTTLAAPTNIVAGQSGVIQFKQHASAVKTLAFNAFWKFPGGTVLTLTDTVNAVDILSYVVDSSGTFAICTAAKDIK